MALSTYKFNGETWIDINNGSPEEIHGVMDSYNIHPFVAKELTSITPKPRIEIHDKYIYCILHFPAWKHTHSDSNQEIDFIISRETLITARYDTIDALDKFAKEIEVGEILERYADRVHRHSHILFMTMLRSLYNSLFEELSYIEDVTKNITAKIFHGKEKEMVVSISEVSRTLLDFKRTVDFHHEILESLHSRGREIFGNDFAYEMEAIIVDYLKINTVIKSNLEMLRELRDTNNSLLTSKQNETVKNLTVVGSIILPLNLIAVIFAMRTENMPLINNPNGFWMILVSMFTVMLITLIYARHKKLI